MPKSQLSIFVLFACSLTAQLRRDSIVVTGTWEPLPLEEVDRSVITLPVRANTLLFLAPVDFLRLDPSLDLRARAPNGVQADISIRGSTFGQTLVLLNGRRLNDPQSGHHNADLPVSLEGIERVEVLRGTGSTLYGADAVGGVVNLITRPPQASEFRLRAGLGNFGTQQQAVSLGLLGRGVAQQLTVARDFSSGFMANRDYRNLTAASHTSLDTAAGTTAVELGYSDRPFGGQAFYGDFPSWERTKTWYAALRQNWSERTESSFAYRRHSDLFYLFRDQPQRYQNHHVAEGWHATLRRREALRSNASLHWGGEGFGDNINSSNLGRHSRARAAAYAAFDIRALRRFSLSAGLRQEVLKGMPGEFAPSLAGGFWVSERLKLRASLSRAFRLPTYTDLYYRDPRNIGNAFLRPERAWGYEGGADWRPASRWLVTATVFERRERDGIDYIRASPADPWRAANLQRLRFTGIETAASYRRGASVWQASYTGLRGAADALPGLESKYVFNYPVHSAVLQWTATLPGSLAARSRLGVLQRLARDPYAVWDVSLARAAGQIRPYVQFANLGAARYEEIIGVPMPGRGVLGGLELVF